VSEARARVGHSHLRPHSGVSSFLWSGVTPGGEVVALSSALVLTAATIEISMVGHLRLFFDLCFVVICLVAAALVRPHDFFTVGVLPPLLMFGTMVIVALNGPKVIAAPHDGVVQAVITGLAHHSLGLFAGYAVCLAVLLARQRLTPH
jgi:hypothetical protein